VSDTPVKPGEEVIARVKTRRRRRPAAPGAEDRDRADGAFLDDEGARYIRRDELKINFYDLGTRLRSVPPTDPFTWRRIRPNSETSLPARDDAQGYFNEYVEMELERAAVAVWPSEILPINAPPPTLADIMALDRILLGSRAPEATDPLDPFGFSPANGSGRRLSHSMPLPYFRPAGAARYAGMVVINGSEERYLHESESAYRRLGKSGAQERWSPRNLEENPHYTYNVALNQGALWPREKRITRLALRPQDTGILPRYIQFDTGDTANFKVTAEPSVTASAVLLKEKPLSGGQVRVYLKPRIVRYTLMHRTLPGPDNVSAYTRTAAIWGRYPYEGLLTGSAADISLATPYTCYARRSRLLGPLIDTLPGPRLTKRFTDLGIPGFGPREDATHLPGTLAGVVTQGSQVCYVWRVTPEVITLPADYNDFNQGDGFGPVAERIGECEG